MCSKCATGKFIRIDNLECLGKCPDDQFALNTKCTKCVDYMKDCYSCPDKLHCNTCNNNLLAN